MVRISDGSTVRARSVTPSREGGSFRLVAPARLSRRERLLLSLFAFGEERALPAEVVLARGRELRVRFSGLNLDEEAHLTRVIFSRADAWVGWDEGHARDRPLRNLGAIAAVAGRGTLRALWTSLRPTRVPRLVRSEA